MPLEQSVIVTSEVQTPSILSADPRAKAADGASVQMSRPASPRMAPRDFFFVLLFIFCSFVGCFVAGIFPGKRAIMFPIGLLKVFKTGLKFSEFF